MLLLKIDRFSVISKALLCTLYTAWATINELKYECCPDKYQDMTFTFVQKRFSYTPVLILLTPCLITAMLILMTFFLPPDSGEKIGLSKFLKKWKHVNC